VRKILRTISGRTRDDNTGEWCGRRTKTELGKRAAKKENTTLKSGPGVRVAAKTHSCDRHRIGTWRRERDRLEDRERYGENEVKNDVVILGMDRKNRTID